MSTNGMIATSQPMAVQAGLEVLKQGGNAMDAAICASAVLCVTEPQSTGIGGDNFILYHENKTGKLHGLNGSGRAPAMGTLEAYQSRGLQAIPERGILSVSIPGAVHAWEQALEKFGSRSLGDMLQPAIDYAESGYAVSPVVAHFWERNAELLKKTESSRKAMLVNDKAPAVGSKHRQPDLARTLRLIATEGSKAFYEGPIAKAISDYMKANDGLIREEDMAAHRSQWVEPIASDYHGLRLFEIPPNGQGIAAQMTLNMLEQVDMGTLDHLSPEHIHLVSEAFKMAIGEREKWVADMDHVEVPVAQMLDKDFAKKQLERFSPDKALEFPVASALATQHKDTVYLSVVDKDGNCCSFINSLYHNFGSGVVAGDTGIMLQNRGAGFVLEPGHANQIAPGKRPMHTIIPAMVYRNDKPVLCFGVMGGQYQAMGHSYVLSNWIDYGMDLQQAIDAPRFLPMDGVLTVETTIPQATREALIKKGHKVEAAEVPLGGGQAIYLDHENGTMHAASDPRKDGCAMGF